MEGKEFSVGIANTTNTDAGEHTCEVNTVGTNRMRATFSCGRCSKGVSLLCSCRYPTVKS